MKTSARFCTFLLAILVSCVPALSQIYKWRDKDGNIVISNYPPPTGVQWEQKKIQESARSPRPAAAAPGNPANQAPRELRNYREVKAILYETEWCGWCHKAGELLTSLGVNLVRYDVEKDPSRAAEVQRKVPGFTGVPLVDVEGIYIKGYSEPLIKKAVEQRRAE